MLEPEQAKGVAEVAFPTAAVAKIVGPIVTSALKAFGSALARPLGQAAKKITDRTIVALQLGFGPYLETSYDKCRTFKSILTPGKPLEVIQHYVNVKMTCHAETITDDTLIDSLNSKKRVVIAGLAGSGKSMFMKYLTVRLFEQPTGTIPLFIELRKMNALTDRKLIPFIRSSCRSKMHAVSQEQFEMALHSGQLMLILDGFDELNHEVRDEIQTQILALQVDFPDTPIIVSSRPDPRFGSWTNFFVYDVQKLDKSQCIKLIQRLEYNVGVKRRFIDAVKSRLFETHESFLSSPLLASIMLLTFEQFAEIPQRMHEFYSQAFDTLLQKHDAQKDQYKRKTHTSLTKEDFRNCFATFCAMSYLEQNFSFKDITLKKTADHAVKYMTATYSQFPRRVTGQQLIDDLRESVCMLQADGLETAFVHRSFQEYFAALFVTNLHGSRVKQFLDSYCARFDDSVIPMAVDMSREVIEKEWVLPAISDIECVFWPDDTPTPCSKKLSSAFLKFSMWNDGSRTLLSVTEMDVSVLGKLEAICKLYPKFLPPEIIAEPFHLVPVSTYRENILRPENRRKAGYKAWERFLAQPAKKNREPTLARLPDFSPSAKDEWWLQAIGVSETFEKIKNGLEAIRKDVQRREKKRANILEDFFS